MIYMAALPIGTGVAFAQQQGSVDGGVVSFQPCDTLADIESLLQQRM